jgi:hypothetical protein
MTPTRSDATISPTPACARRPRTRHDHADVREPLADDLERVVQRTEHDDRRAVLVVVEDRDVEQVAQPLLDLEAARRGDVLEVDAGEDRGDELDRPDDLVGVLGVEADREGVDAGEPLEERGLALHHGERREGPEVAQPEHGRPVGDDGDGVALDGEPTGVVGRLRDRLAHPRDAGRVDEAEVVAVADRDLGHDLQLAAEVDQEGAVADPVDSHPLQPAQGFHQLLGVGRRRGRAGHVELDPVVPGTRDVEGRHHSSSPLHDRGHLADRRATRRQLQSDGDGVRDAGNAGHGGAPSVHGAGCRPDPCTPTGPRGDAGPAGP